MSEFLAAQGKAEVVVRDRRASAQLEVRDPSAATQRLQWHSPGLPIVQDWDADKAWRYGVIANVIAWRCVQLRANAGSSVPLRAGVRRNGRREVRDSAPIARLLGPPPGGPAPKLSARKLIRWTFGQEIVTGRRAWEIETNTAGRPVAFWPLVSAELREIPTKAGTEWFRVFEYGPTNDPVTLRPDQVFYGWDPSGLDFRKADAGAIGAARYDLSLVTLSDRYGMAFLQNNAVPATVVTTTVFPNEQARQTFRSRWSHEYEGVDNAGRVHFHEVDDDGEGPVGDSIDVKVLGLSAKDARLVEGRKEAMMEIAISLGVPWSKLDASGRTFDNAGIEDRTFWEETVLPDLIDLEDDINMQLAPRLGDETVWFDIDSVRALKRRVQPVTQSVGAPELLFARIMTINEARDDYGLDLIDDGDRFLTDDEIGILKGAGSDSEAVRSALIAIEHRHPEMPPAPVDDDERSGTPELPPPALPPEPAAEHRATPEELAERRAVVWRATDAVITSIEGRWMRSLRRLFARQADATVNRLTGKRGRQAIERRAPGDPIDAAALFDVEFWRDETGAIVEDLYLQAAGAGLDRIALSFSTSFDLEAPWVRQFISTRANQLAGQVTQTTYDAIVDELVDGVAAGESIDDLAARIRTVFVQADQVRAERIARTEVISAYNGAAVGGVDQLPADVVAAVEWIATADGRTREDHAFADGQVALRGLPFNVGGVAMAYPGDPAAPASQVVNCRCTVALLTPEEYLERIRRPLRIEQRTAQALVALVSPGEFDEPGFRRALQEVAA